MKRSTADLGEAMMDGRIRYRADRGGHAPERFRGAFVEWLEECGGDVERAPATWGQDEDEVSIDAVLGMLWNCTDVLPGFDVDLLDLSGRTSYAAAVRAVKARRSPQEGPVSPQDHEQRRGGGA